MAIDTAKVGRTLELCTWVARRENVRLRMSRLGSVSKEAMEPLQQELAFAELQLSRMRADPGYRALPDPRTVNPEHVACEREADSLRSQNLQLKVARERLWAKASHLEAELRKYKPTRYPVGKAARGRPSRQVEGVAALAAQLESLTGIEAGRSKNAYQLVLSRPALERVILMLKEADECRAIHQNPGQGF